ncbi:hypothetical protein [Sediminibacillus sp. JSM 1682029]|uniref:hypothetical protein n=1 Tax=Sediminibacillus sp. JSM 1682029 TaxID=3229857 RepID=UPI0035236FEF
MNMGNYKIIKGENGVKVLNGNKMIELKNIDYQHIKSLCEQKNIHIHNQFFASLSQKMHLEVKTAQLKTVYSLGNQTLFVSNYCERCLALLFPISTLVHHKLPSYLESQLFRENKQVIMDKFGIVSIKSLMNISHVSCCPVDKKEVEEILPEGKINERNLRDSILSNAVSRLAFKHDKGVWKIEANIFGKNQLFLGVSKQSVVEKLYVYILCRYYHYSEYGIGFTPKSAYLNLRRKSLLNHFEGNEKQLVNIGHLLREIGISYPISKASFIHIDDKRLPFSVLKLVVKDRSYNGIGFSLEECLVDIVEQVESGRAAIQNKELDENRNKTLYRYRDALSDKYQFIILGEG